MQFVFRSCTDIDTDARKSSETGKAQCTENDAILSPLWKLFFILVGIFDVTDRSHMATHLTFASNTKPIGLDNNDLDSVWNMSPGFTQKMILETPEVPVLKLIDTSVQGQGTGDVPVVLSQQLSIPIMLCVCFEDLLIQRFS